MTLNTLEKFVSAAAQERGWLEDVQNCPALYKAICGLAKLPAPTILPAKAEPAAGQHAALTPQSEPRKRAASGHIIKGELKRFRPTGVCVACYKPISECECTGGERKDTGY